MKTKEEILVMSVEQLKEYSSSNEIVSCLDYCNNCDYCKNCKNCKNCNHCESCDNCKNCLFCKSLKNKSLGYWICNVEVTKEEYEVKLKEL